MQIEIHEGDTVIPASAVDAVRDAAKQINAKPESGTVAIPPRPFWVKVHAKKLYNTVWLLIVWIVWAIKLRFARIDENAKCPACGARSGKIRFDYNFTWPDNSKGAVIHYCLVDQAVWAEKPIVRAEQWHVDAASLPDIEEGTDVPLIVKPEAITRESASKRTKPFVR